MSDARADVARVTRGTTSALPGASSAATRPCGSSRVLIRGDTEALAPARIRVRDLEAAQRAVPIDHVRDAVVTAGREMRGDGPKHSLGR